MSDAAASAAAPGWYPDGSGGQRWWDGRGWTDHVAPASGTAPAGPIERTRLADDLNVDGAWVWIISVVPIVACLPLIFLFDFRGYMIASITGDLGLMMSSVGLYLVLSLVLGWGTFALTVVGAYRDRKRLESLGVVRPFHWAFAFLGTIVYLIGRHVILRKVTKTPGWPLWVHIALNVVALIVIGVWTGSMMVWMFSEIPYLVGSGYGSV